MPPTLTVSGQKFVLIPAGEYRDLKAKAAANSKPARAKRRLSKQDRGDIAESLRRLKSDEFVPLDEVARELGFRPSTLKR
ncbi:MAG TPA: hypothetical protein VIL86_01785 [Tepidisphaeraceae bacterium]|jgi:hypothetical protein